MGPVECPQWTDGQTDRRTDGATDDKTPTVIYYRGVKMTKRVLSIHQIVGLDGRNTDTTLVCE